MATNPEELRKHWMAHGLPRQTLDPDPIKRVTFGSPSPMIFDHLEDRNLAAYQGILKPARSAFEPARRIPVDKE